MGDQGQTGETQMTVNQFYKFVPKHLRPSVVAMLRQGVPIIEATLLATVIPVLLNKEKS